MLQLMKCCQRFEANVGLDSTSHPSRINTESKFFLEIYAGKQPDGPFSISNKPSDVVQWLAAPIYNSGRNITADNWFSDINLVKALKKKRLSYVGTLRKNKRELPPELVTVTKRSEKLNAFAFSEDCTLVSHVPKKGKNVILVYVCMYVP